PPGEADDCAQAVFLVLARRPQAAARAPLAPWLLRPAALVCRCARRGAERRRRAERQAPPPEPAPARNEALEHLDECLQQLPERQRLAVSLHYLTGVPADDIAARLGTSRANAYQLLSRGLAGLRALLARRGVAVPAAGLAALLAGEAQAAAAPAASATVIALASGDPRPAAHTLAQETIAAMSTHIAFPAVVGSVVATTLVAGAIAWAAAGVPVPGRPAAEPPAPALLQPLAALPPAAAADRPSAGATAAAADPARVEDILRQKVSLDFDQVGLTDVTAFIRQVTGQQVHLAPLPHAAGVTMEVREMALGDVLAWIALLCDCTLERSGGRCTLVPTADASPDGNEAVDLRPRSRVEGLQVTVELSASDPRAAVKQLHALTRVNLLIHPRAFPDGLAITVPAQTRPAMEVVQEIARQAGCDLLERNDGIGFVPRGRGQPVPPAGRQ
ncbi:MAG: RNA polymerase sigma factor, partial [Planctomycetes bacterium]|nr:RNA polymerase sigma factor [Planctomycetota bacterium]